MGTKRRFECCCCLILVGLLCSEALSAAPTISGIGFRSPSRGQVGEPVVIEADGLTAPVRVFFSDGANPTVEATPVLVDAGSGTILTHVPSGAMTGNMKVTAAGVDSPLYRFLILPGAFAQGTDVVSGQVTNGATPLSGVLMALLRNNICEKDAYDFTVTDAMGRYTMHGVNGNYDLFGYAPAASGLASAGATVTLTSSPVTQNLALSAGTNVTGRVVDAISPTTGIANARVGLNGPTRAGVLADSSGNFAIRLLAGSWDITIEPPLGNAHASVQGSVNISGANQNLGNVPLASGVRISGTVTRATDGSLLSGAQVLVANSATPGTLVDGKLAAGDGTFSLFVPQNQTYLMAAFLDVQAIEADVLVTNVVVGTTNVVRDLAAADAAFITGTATDVATSTGIPNLDITTSGGSGYAQTRTCDDGSYRLRVVPDATGYLVSTAQRHKGGSPYARQTWNNTLAGTYFECEGVPVSAPAAGGTIGAINFRDAAAAAIQGQASSQAGGCADDLGSQGIVVDDGSSHACGMGLLDSSQPPPGYRISNLPPSSVVSSLRACAYFVGLTPQCYNTKSPPAYDPIVVSPGGSATGINFCLSQCATPQTWYQDADGDGHGNPGASVASCFPPAGYVLVGDDCDDLNPQVWGTPGEARNLIFPNKQTLNWSAPANLGGTSVVYDTLRSVNPADFVTVAVCVESNDGPNTMATDLTTPPLHGTFYYLVRAENACPSGQGLLGTRSHGVPIAGRNCP